MLNYRLGLLTANLLLGLLTDSVFRMSLKHLLLVR